MPLFFVALHLLILVLSFASLSPQAVYQTMTTPGGNSQPIESVIVRILQQEMGRKLEELHDVQKAFAFLITNWSEAKNSAANPSQHCYTVQQAWIRSDWTWNYRDRLEEAVKKIEGEISAIRKELVALAIAQHGSK